MARPRPRKKPPDESGGVKEHDDEVEPAALNSKAHQMADIRNLWEIHPRYDDGLKITLGKSGSLVLSQTPMMGDEATIVLALNEAEELLELLPEAINTLRKALRG